MLFNKWRHTAVLNGRRQRSASLSCVKKETLETGQYHLLPAIYVTIFMCPSSAILIILAATIFKGQTKFSRWIGLAEPIRPDKLIWLDNELISALVALPFLTKMLICLLPSGTVIQILDDIYRQTFAIGLGSSIWQIFIFRSRQM